MACGKTTNPKLYQVDNAKFAELIGTSTGTAQVAWTRLKAKLQHLRTNNITTVGIDAAQSSAKASTTPKKSAGPPKTAHDAVDEPKAPTSGGRKRKAKNATSTADIDGDTAAKGNKKKKKKSNPVVKQEDEESDSGPKEDAADTADANGDDMDD